MGEAPELAALELDHVSKRFSLGQRGGVLGGLLRRTTSRRELWALRDISLRLDAGESVGLIGHNGAGKTTLLKLLAGISRPTRGYVRTQGRVASLINLGAGFHPELTGRENIFLNGVILGLSRREVRQRFHDIVTTTKDFQVRDLRHLSHFYFVSVEAMARRLEELSLIPKGSWQYLKEAKFAPKHAAELLGLQPLPTNDEPYPERYKYLAVHAYERGEIGDS